MILVRLLKEIFGARGASSPSWTPAPVPTTNRSFARRADVPSILALTHSYQGNGAAEMMTFLLVRLVSDLGWQVTALATEVPEADQEMLARIGVGVVDAVDAAQYDLAIANTVVSGLDNVMQIGRRLPCLLWVHEGETVLSANVPLGYWKQAFSLCAHVVFQSRWQAERIFGSFTSALPESRYSIIPNCLPTMPTTGGITVPKPPGKKRIVFIGGVYIRKRPWDLVAAVQELGRQDVECLFIGETDYVGTLPVETQRAFENDPRFRLLGEMSRSQTAAYLASADILSLPSGDESQPLVLLEAAHFGVPVVISDLPVYRDIWVDGKNCLKHPVGDTAALAAHLQTCLEGRAPPPTILEGTEVTVAAFLSRFETVLRDLLPADGVGTVAKLATA